MIRYNNRYRGPQEYDKFVINILSLNNVIESFYEIEKSTDINDFKTLALIHKDIISMYNKFTGEYGLDEKCYLISICNKEN